MRPRSACAPSSSSCTRFAAAATYLKNPGCSTLVTDAIQRKLHPLSEAWSSSIGFDCGHVLVPVQPREMLWRWQACKIDDSPCHPAQLMSSLQGGCVSSRPTSAGKLHGLFRDARRVAPRSCDVPCQDDDRARLIMVSQVRHPLSRQALPHPFLCLSGSACSFLQARAFSVPSCRRHLQCVQVKCLCWADSPI